MGREIHYEIFRRVGARGGWTLHEVASSREVALEGERAVFTLQGQHEAVFFFRGSA